LKGKRDYIAASDFSPGIDDRFGTAEELKVKSKKLKGKRDYIAASDFSPGIYD
jgi:hypothetical protein